MDNNVPANIIRAIALARNMLRQTSLSPMRKGEQQDIIMHASDSHLAIVNMIAFLENVVSPLVPSRVYEETIANDISDAIAIFLYGRIRDHLGRKPQSSDLPAYFEELMHAASQQGSPDLNDLINSIKNHLSAMTTDSRDSAFLTMAVDAALMPDAIYPDRSDDDGRG